MANHLLDLDALAQKDTTLHLIGTSRRQGDRLTVEAAGGDIGQIVACHLDAGLAGKQA